MNTTKYPARIVFVYEPRSPKSDKEKPAGAFLADFNGNRTVDETQAQKFYTLPHITEVLDKLGLTDRQFIVIPVP